MNDFTSFISILILTVTVLYTVTAFKVGWKPSSVIKRLEKSGARKGITMAVVAVVLLGLVFSFVYAEEEYKYFGSTTVFAGIDYDLKNTPIFCEEGDVNDRLTSNFGIRQHLIGKGHVDVSAQYTHHSCALNRDKPTYDAVGLQLKWKFQRR